MAEEVSVVLVFESCFLVQSVEGGDCDEGVVG